ncbi:hypothetical protein sphantq_01998 [Sphingobium sp. AntQ-1]|uniref:DUF805 domain-containing protein n=1 Tax=Sphingobium sp. AntQ-1 TaxID=2930091 RepID=UPI00234E56F8|nr:DUF805 domain-containing protein [Sphingobium sp. AntQ-1]WCP13569.1 hypothetical protein sphantq_01998 [Sphingobium sp. AntQ-1]
MQGLLALKRYIQFLGRADRKEYWQFIGIVAVAYAVSIIVGNGIAYMQVGLLPPSLIFTMLFFTPPLYCATIRRLHDRGISALWLAAIWVLNGVGYTLQNLRQSALGTAADTLLALLGYANAFLTIGFVIWLLLHLCREGDPAANEFGPPPIAGDGATRNTESSQLINQALIRLFSSDPIKSEPKL